MDILSQKEIINKMHEGFDRDRKEFSDVLFKRQPLENKPIKIVGGQNISVQQSGDAISLTANIPPTPTPPLFPLQLIPDNQNLRVNYGSIDGVVPSNISSNFTPANNDNIYLKATYNPIGLKPSNIEVQYGASIPTDGDNIKYIPLGQVSKIDSQSPYKVITSQTNGLDNKNYIPPTPNANPAIMAATNRQPQWISAASSSGTFVLGCVNGSLTWLQTEAC